MSGGPSAPSNLLIQRLDTALGITLAKHGTLTRGQQPAFAPHVDRSDPVAGAGRRQEQPAREPAARETNRQAALDQTRQTRLGAAKGFDLAALSKLFPSSPTSLGQAARTIMSVLQQYPQTQLPPQPQLRAPLFPNPPGQSQQAQPGNSPAQAAPGSVSQALASSGMQGPSVMQLALALARTVTQSGLFYESQLARATYGQQPMARVHAQPQAHLQMPEAAHQGRTSSPMPHQAYGAQAQSSTNGAPTGLQPGSTTGQMLNTGAPPLPPEVTLIVRQQLDILAQQSVMFQGEAWPGTQMEWEIERRQGQQQDANEASAEDAEHWHSHLTLHLPQLGTIAADLRLQNGHWSVHLSSTEHADTLQRHATRLQSRFQASGLSLSELQIGTPDDSHEPG
ncbi:MAG: flagellar hook-length control protein FliK [Corticimicrobacter sp.]|uniref:flagellar hook-length control protein FliK n=1 Tax=Corticimicrobacter sp. TaxID=2678536 RepID=UPI0032DBB952